MAEVEDFLHESRHRKGGPDNASPEEEPAPKTPCLEDNRIRVNELNTSKVADNEIVSVEQKSVPRQSRQETPEEMKKLLRETHIRHAHLALKLYHEQKESVGHELELVRPICTYPFVRRCLWYHVNFMAKPKNASDEMQQLYFAEIEHWSQNEDFLITFGPVKADALRHDLSPRLPLLDVSISSYALLNSISFRSLLKSVPVRVLLDSISFPDLLESISFSSVSLLGFISYARARFRLLAG